MVNLPSKKSKSQTVLLAVTGMSPAILTETVWALAHEDIPVIPDRVIAVTTITGRQAIERELLTPPVGKPQDAHVWNDLRSIVLGKGFQSDDRLMIEPRLIHGKNSRTGQADWLEDIRLKSDNEAVADALLEIIRSFTENPDTRIIASIAGGRKTMGALLYAAMSLLGRSNDRVTHVLVNDPFDSPALQPKFYFPHWPTLEHKILDRQGNIIETIDSSKAGIELADIPFVCLRNLFPGQLGRLPGSFTDLVHEYSHRIEDFKADSIDVSVDLKSSSLILAGKSVKLNGKQMALVAYLIHNRRPQSPLIWQEHKQIFSGLHEDFLDAFLKEINPASREFEMARFWKKAEFDDVRKVLAEIRSKLRKSGLTPQMHLLFPPHH